MLTWIFLVVCIFLLVRSLQQVKRRLKGLPPGPFCLPGIGCMVQIFLADPLPFIAFQKLSKYYGNIFSVQIGLVHGVVINGYEAIHEIYQNDDWINIRAVDKFILDRTFGKPFGFVAGQGNIWKESRRFSARTLKEFGFGVNKSMEALIQGELDEFSTSIVHQIEKTNGIVLVDKLFNTASLNITWSMVSGNRFSYDDPKLLELVAFLDEFFRSGSLGAGLLTSFPFLTDWAPKLVGFDKQKKANRSIQEYLNKIITEVRSQGQYRTSPSNFIEVFLQKVDKRESHGDLDHLVYSDESLISILYDLLFAGTETSSNTLAFGFLHLILNPDIQEKIRNEIADVIGSHRSPALQDREKMKFTDATILEIIRMSAVVAITPRILMEDSTIGKYRARKGTTVFLNLYSVAMDEDVWGDPHVFRPERFLNSHGNIINSDRLLLFGAGKRNCIGESVARATIFIMFTGLIQKFNFAINPAEGTPSTERVLGFTVSPKPFTMTLTPRDDCRKRSNGLLRF